MLEKLFNWIGSNKVGIVLIVVAISLFSLGLVGCSWGDIIQVRVPGEISKGLGVRSKLPLTDAERAFNTWAAAGEQLAKSIEGGWETVGLVQGLLGQGATIAASAFPGAAAALPLLSLLGGIFIKGPGTGKEKEKSYNAGLEEGRRLAMAGANLVRGEVPT